MRQGLLSIFEASLFFSIVVLWRIWRQDEHFERPVVAKLTKSYWTIVHINFIFILVLECSSKVELLACCFNWELLISSLIFTKLSEHAFGVHQVEMKIVGDAVCSH